MKEKILELIEDYESHRILKAEYLADEIESLIKENYVEKEFMVWTSQFTEVIPYTIEYYLIGSGLPEMQFDELYQYWQTNIKCK